MFTLPVGSPSNSTDSISSPDSSDLSFIVLDSVVSVGNCLTIPETNLLSLEGLVAKANEGRNECWEAPTRISDSLDHILKEICPDVTMCQSMIVFPKSRDFIALHLTAARNKGNLEEMMVILNCSSQEGDFEESLKKARNES